MHWKGRGVHRLPLQGAQPMPSHCLPERNCQAQRRLQPTVTTPNRFGNHLQPPIQPLVPSLLMHPWLGYPPHVYLKAMR